MGDKREPKEMQTFREILLQSTLLDFKMTNLESNINCKTKELDVLNKTLADDNKEIEQLKKQIALLEEQGNRVKRNVEAHRLSKATLESLTANLAQQLKITNEKNSKIKESHNAILVQYEKKWERHEETYNKLPWVRDRNKLRNEVKLNTIFLNMAKKKMYDEMKKARLFKEITNQRYQNAVVKFAEGMVSREEHWRKVKQQENENKKLEDEIEELRLKLNEVSAESMSRTKNAVANAKERAERLQAEIGLFSVTGCRPSSHSNYSTPASKYPIPQRSAVSTPSGPGRWSALTAGTGSGDAPLLPFVRSFGISKPPESLLKLLLRRGVSSTTGSAASSPQPVEASPQAEATTSSGGVPESEKRPEEPPEQPEDAPGKSSEIPAAAPVPLEEPVPDSGPSTESQAPQTNQPPQKEHEPETKKKTPVKPIPSNRPRVYLQPEKPISSGSATLRTTPRPVLQRKNITFANAQNTRFFKPTLEIAEPEPKRLKRTPPAPPMPFHLKTRPVPHTAKPAEPQDKEEQRQTPAEIPHKPEAEPKEPENDPPISDKDTLGGVENENDKISSPLTQSSKESDEQLFSQSSSGTPLSPIPGMNETARSAYLDNLMRFSSDKFTNSRPDHSKEKNVMTPGVDYFSQLSSDVDMSQSQESVNNQTQASSPVFKYSTEFPKMGTTPLTTAMSPIFGGLSSFKGSTSDGKSDFGSLFFSSSNEGSEKNKPSSSASFFNLQF